MSWNSQNKKVYFLKHLFCPKKIFRHLCFIILNSAWNKLCGYIYFYTSKNIILYSFLLDFKIVDSLQSILKLSHLDEKILSPKLFDNFINSKETRKSSLFYQISSSVLLVANPTSTKNFKIPK